MHGDGRIRSGGARRRGGDRLRHGALRHRHPRRAHRGAGRPHRGRRSDARCRRPAGAARRRRQPLPYRGALPRRLCQHRRHPTGHGERGELRQCQHLGLRRGHDLGRLLRAAVEARRHPAAAGRLRAARGEGDGGLQLPPDHHRPDAGCAGARGAADRRQGDPQPEGLPDLRAAAPFRRGIHQGPGHRPEERLPGHRALRELRRHQVADRGAAGRRHDLAEIPCLVAPGHRRARGDAPRHRAGRAGGPADPGLPCQLRRGGGGDRPGAASRPEGLGRDLPAIPDPDRRRHGPAGLRGCGLSCAAPPPAPPRNTAGSGR